MATFRKVITDQYVDILVPVDKPVYIQNRGSATVEIYLGASTPHSGTEGLTLEPGQLGLNFALEAEEACYIKTEVSGKTSQIVGVH